GQGIMNEALEKILEFGIKTIALASIEAYTHKENMNSIKLLKKHNFELNTEIIDNENLNNIIFTLSKQ
ncbi:MAG: GNAT family N-acetyltransferase, partial [Ignavibacteriaceae bacterium]|nr:GNAT family N-acetyltransferase [Ignavibacteriaceae bacterium]